MRTAHVRLSFRSLSTDEEAQAYLCQEQEQPQQQPQPERYHSLATDAEAQAYLKKQTYKEKRAPRPGQAPPQRRAGACCAAGAPDSDAVFYDDDVAAAPGAASTSTYAQRVKQQHERFSLRRAAAAEHLREFAVHQQPAADARRAGFEQQELLERARAAAARHGCCLAGSCAVASSDEAAPVNAAAQISVQLGARQVTYTTLGFMGEVRVPVISCGACGTSMEAMPEQLGCVAPSPDVPQQLFDMRLVEFFTSLQALAGVGGDRFVQAQAASLRGFEWWGDPPINSDRALAAAGMEWLRLKAAALEDLGNSSARTGLGPLPDCPACAFVDVDPEEYAGAQLPSYLPISFEDGPPRTPRLVIKAVTADATMKLCRYRNAGAAHEGIPPTLKRFFGPANAEVWDIFEGGKPEAAARRPADDEDGAEAACPHPRLSCARESAKAGGVTDVKAVMGHTCAHGVPLDGSFVASPWPECALIYDVTLEHLGRRCDIMDYYLDTSCQYMPHRARLGIEDGPYRFLLDWVHAYGHGEACFRANSGMFAEGAGRRTGETCEQLWGQTKPPAKVARYMALPKFIDFVEGVLDGITAAKARGFVRQLAAMQRLTEAKLAECRQRLQALETEAAERGISVDALRAAAGEVRAPARQAPVEDETATRLRVLGEYIAKHNEVQALKNASQLYEGADGKQLRVRSQDPAHLQSLEKQLARLLKRLGRAQPPPVDGPEWRAGLEALRDTRVRGLRAKAEREVGELQRLRSDRQHDGEASSSSRDILKRSKAARKRLDAALKELQYWRRVKAPDGTELADGSGLLTGMPELWSDEEVKRLISGDSPWAAGRQLGPAATLQLLATRHHDTSAELTRCEEELELLKWERTKTLAYYKYMAAAHSAAAGEQETLAGQQTARMEAAAAAGGAVEVGACNAAAEAAGVHHTKAAILRRMSQWYEQQHNKAVKEFAGMPSFANP